MLVWGGGDSGLRWCEGGPMGQGGLDPGRFRGSSEGGGMKGSGSVRGGGHGGFGGGGHGGFGWGGHGGFRKHQGGRAWRVWVSVKRGPHELSLCGPWCVLQLVSFRSVAHGACYSLVSFCSVAHGACYSLVCFRSVAHSPLMLP